MASRESELPRELLCDESITSEETRAIIREAWRAVAGLVTVTLIEGKALGVIATCDIAAGQLLLQEWPLLQLRPDGAGRYDGTYDGERERARALLSTLSSAKPGAGDLGGVIETNGIVVNHGQPGAFTVVNLMISRCNHSCAPNAVFVWDAVLELGRLDAKRPIPAGTEVTINYGAHGGRMRRQRILSQRFNFMCECELCCLSGEALKRNDALEEEHYSRESAVSSDEEDAELEASGVDPHHTTCVW